MSTSAAARRLLKRRGPPPGPRAASARAGELVRLILEHPDSGPIHVDNAWRARKRRRQREEAAARELDDSDDDDDDDDDGGGGDHSSIPSDTLAAVQWLMRRHQARLRTAVPLTLVHHLYSVVADRSAVDRELQLGRERGQLRLLFVSTGIKTDRALIFEADYRGLCGGIAARLRAEGRVGDAVVVKRFAEKVLPAALEMSITEARLRALVLSQAAAPALCAAGLLIRRVDAACAFDSRSYWFTVPRLGDAVLLVSEARRLLVDLVARKHHKEALAREVVRLVAPKAKANANANAKRPKHGRGSMAAWRAAPTARLRKALATLGAEYHIMDAVQAGILRSIDTGMGPLLKLPR